jgi:hypothetical protein
LKPTIGRIVWFKPRADHAAGVELGGELLPAMIVRVIGEEDSTLVNLQVFTDNHRGVRWETSVELGKGPGQWCWPEVAR